MFSKYRATHCNFFRINSLLEGRGKIQNKLKKPNMFRTAGG